VGGKVHNMNIAEFAAGRQVFDYCFRRLFSQEDGALRGAYGMRHSTQLIGRLG